ncbi:serine/threonine-protein kinase Nek10-like isoform X2 [Camelus ferus]|uniref:Serine/threonine-protein kinase Nek10-like isoform X2 n=1 Tax=Camelus ferus TaxID=419612 RepID=A0A8B8RA98_CAMFR|nr:serine/threonine-protein kinase Nek10-like isoform X2 [Camelus ferus]
MEGPAQCVGSANVRVGFHGGGSGGCRGGGGGGGCGSEWGAAAVAADTGSEMVRGQACDVGRPTLPPALHHNLKRRIIERFKKIFFSQQSNPCNLKSEIKKLSQGSPEPIEHQITIYCIIHQVNTACPQITQQTVIEEVLEESGYHSYPWGTKNHPAK